jgi:hypothetical protein
VVKAIAGSSGYCNFSVFIEMIYVYEDDWPFSL